MKIRRATLADAGAIRSIIAPYARHRIMLPRPKREVCEHVRDYFVAEDPHKRKGDRARSPLRTTRPRSAPGSSYRVRGCCGLRVWTDRCAEIYSLAVRRSHNTRGIGTHLVRACLKEAARLGVRRVLAFTSVQTWFSRLGFRQIPLKLLPHVVYREKFIRGERAMYLDLPHH